MSHAVPAKKSILEDIRDRALKGPLSEFDFVRFGDAARKEIEVNPAMGHDALGMLACLRGDEKGMRKFHMNALRLSGRASQHLSNFAVSLAQLNRLEEAQEYQLEAAEKDPTNLLQLRFLIALLHKGRSADRLALYLERWNSLSQSPYEDISVEIEADYLSKYKSIQSSFGRGELSEDEAAMYKDMLFDTEDDIASLHP